MRTTLLTKLTGGSVTQAPYDGGWPVRKNHALLQQLLYDVMTILNTRPIDFPGIDDYPELAHSTLTAGFIRPAPAQVLDTVALADYLASAVERCEPRLVNIQLEELTDSKPGQCSFNLMADLAGTEDSVSAIVTTGPDGISLTEE